MNRLGLKISCFVVSVVIWIQVASISEVEQGTTLPLRLIGLAEGLTIAGSDVPEQVSVRVRGSKLKLLRHNYFNSYIGEFRVDLGSRNPGPAFDYDLDVSDAFTDLAGIVVYPPVRLRLHIDRELSRTYPLRTNIRGGLDDEIALLTPVMLRPDSVIVTGPERYFDPTPAVSTPDIDLSRISSSTRMDLPVSRPHEHLEVQPAKVEVVIEVADKEDRTLANIPVLALVDSGQPEVGVSPPIADVMVRGVQDSVRALTNDRILVTVPVGDLPEGVYALPGQVDYPSWLTIIGIDPPVFQVIVGNPPVLDEPEDSIPGEEQSGG